MSRAEVMAEVVDPIYPTPHVDLHPTCDLNHNLIVRPKSGRMDVPIGQRSPKYKLYCIETHKIEKSFRE